MPEYEIVSLAAMVPSGLVFGVAWFYFWRWRCRRLADTHIGQSAAAKGLWRLSAALGLYWLVQCAVDLAQHHDPAAMPYFHAQGVVGSVATYLGSWLVWRRRGDEPAEG